MNEKRLSRTRLLNEEEIDTTVQRIAYALLERHGHRSMAFVGIHTRGVAFAERVTQVVSERNPNILKGTLDITLYRDDLDNLGTIPQIRDTDIPFDVEGAVIVLFDDVLFTGRTIRAAINVLMDYGRPARIELAVLVDRGNRELPICPDYTGRVHKTQANEYISVRFRETDQEDGVYLLRDTEEDNGGETSRA